MTSKSIEVIVCLIIVSSLPCRGRRASDLYEKTFSRFREQQRGRNKLRKGSSDDIPLHSSINGQSDQAYETLYEDDDIVDTAQTMPWFDPKYLASGKDAVRSIQCIMNERFMYRIRLLNLYI